MTISRYILGVDVGGTKVEVALLKEVEPGSGRETLALSGIDGRGVSLEIIARQRRPTQRELGCEHIVTVVSNLIRDVCRSQSVAHSEVDSVGFGLPGSINPATNVMTSGNTQVLVGHDLAALVQSSLGWRCGFYCDNDANCFALAEALCGAGHRHQADFGVDVRRSVAIGIILGTGCGAGIVIQAKVLRGRDGSAGEVGHMAFSADGPACYCGRNGCPEQFLSGPALEALFASRTSKVGCQVVSAATVFERAKQQNPVAVAVVDEYRQTLARFVGSLNSIFNPDFFVLGGGVSQQAAIYEGLEQLVACNSFIQSNPVQIYQSQLGDSSGVLGAALLPFVD